MTKLELLEFTPQEAFKHGRQCHESGHSIDYNPYRNTDLNDSHLHNAWILGWKSAISI